MSCSYPNTQGVDVYRQHPSTFIGGEWFPKGHLHINEQQCFWKGTREFEETCILRKWVAKPNSCRGNPITDCLTAIQCTVATLTRNRPIYVVDLSKLHMYDFHYNHMRVKYPRQLLFTDTASLAYAVQTEDTYRDMA